MKEHKITYKLYRNERLKTVMFHGAETHPLYVQVSYRRRHIYFKSYYFDLLSSPKYMIQAPGSTKAPGLKDVEKLETGLLDYIVSKHAAEFSVDGFPGWYEGYGRDLCTVTEEGFVRYLHTFFADKGFPSMADALREGCRLRPAFDLVRDMEAMLKPALYDELVGNALHYAPPYLPLYAYMRDTRKWPFLLLTYREWDDASSGVRKGFEAYAARKFPDADIPEIVAEVEKYAPPGT